MDAPRIQYAKTSDGVNIAYAAIGEGPPIVFASNIWGNLHAVKLGVLWTGEFARLNRLGWSILTYDGRGSGSSSREVADYSLEARLLDLEIVIEKAALERFPLCGITQGVPTAIAYAARHPERVSQLILCNPHANGREYYARVPALRLTQETLEMAADEWEFHLETLAHAIAGFSDTGRAQVLVDLFRAGMNPADYLAFRRSAIEFDLSDLLPGLSMPTLVVLDTTYKALAVAPIAQEVAAQITNSRYVESTDLASEISDFLGKGRMAQGAETSVDASSLRTVLFTDLVGHTEMMSRLGDDKGRDVLREHEQLTREVLKANGGTEVKTMGDGFMASFGSVTKAVECAVALQRKFEVRRGKLEVEDLSVRVGLNAGEPIEEDGDLFGATVILASRIAARAAGGEILVADTVRGLCSGKGFMFADRGEFKAKGFDEPVRVSEVRWRDG